MFETLTNAWMLTLPTLVTAFLLLRKFKELREREQAKALVPAPIPQETQGK